MASIEGLSLSARPRCIAATPVKKAMEGSMPRAVIMGMSLFMWCPSSWPMTASSSSRLAVFNKPVVTATYFPVRKLP